MPKKPSKNGFEQKRVGDSKPGGFATSPLDVACTIHLNQNGRSIDFSLVETLQPGQAPSGVIVEEISPDKAPTGRFHFAITRDTKLSITLAKNIDWRWAQNQTAITTKSDNSRLYAVDGGFDDPIGDTIVLCCKARGGKDPKIDSCNFSVDLRQSKGSYLPVTIDPDIRNPPPGSG